MPAVQFFDPRPLERKETNLEKVVGGFVNKFQENRKEAKDISLLTDIYKKYQNEGQSIEDALIAVKTTSGLSPTRRVEETNSLLNMQKTNAQLQAAALRNEAKVKNQQEKVDKEETKRIEEAEQDDLEVNFLQSLEGQNMKSSEIYTKGRQLGLKADRIGKIANLHRLESKEDRLTEGDLARQYDFDIRELDKRIKATDSPKAKKPLQQERDKLVNMRKGDLARYRSGDRNFTPALYGISPEKAAAEVSEEVEQADPVIVALTQTYPPANFKGQSKWDKQGNEYKSDGKEWHKVQK